MSQGGNSGNYFKAGDWNAICDLCGFRYKASELKKNWKGEMVCPSDFELRHPQEFVRVRPEKISVPWARPESDLFVGPACFIWDSSGYTGLGIVGCAQVGNVSPVNPQTSIQLYALKFPPPPA